MKEETSTRLKEIMKERNLKPVDVLNLCKPYCIKYNIKLEKSHLSKYLKGTIKPKQDKLTILGLALNVSETWLMGYDVPQMRVQHLDYTKPNFQRWLKEVGEIEWNDEEMSELINYAKFILSKRSGNN